MRRTVPPAWFLFMAWVLLGGAVQQVVNSVAVGSVTGLGTGVATLLGGASSGTGGPVGTSSPTIASPTFTGTAAGASTIPGSMLSLGQLTNTLGADVNLNNTGSFFDGPSVAQGVTGTWFASGTVTLQDTGAAAVMICKLWDGTTVIASGRTATSAAGVYISMQLSGYLASPAANIKISCNDASATTGKIIFNGSGAAKDATLAVYRIN